MNFQEYLQTDEYKKVASKKRISQKKNLIDLCFALFFLLLAVALFIVIKAVPDSVKHEKWFLVTVITVTIVCFVAASVIEIVFFVRGKSSWCNFLDPHLGAGILLLLRENPVEIKHFVKDGELVVPVCYHVGKNTVQSVDFGEKDPATLDLSPWNGVEHSDSIGVAALPVLDFLLNSDIYSLAITSVCILPSASDESEREAGKPIFLVKKGRWTITGRMLRGDCKRSLKLLKKWNEVKSS